MLVDSRSPFDDNYLSQHSPTFQRARSRLSGVAHFPSDFPWLDILNEVIEYNQRSEAHQTKLKQQFNELAAEHQQYLARSNNIAADLERLKVEQIGTLQSKVHLEENIQHIQRQLNQSEEFREGLSEQLMLLQREKEGLENRLSEIERTKSTLERDLEESQQQIQRLRVEVESLTQTIQTEKEEVATLKTKMGSLRLKRNRSQSDLRRTRVHVETLHQDLATANASLGTTQERLSRTEELYAHFQEVLSDRDRRESLYSDFISDLHQKVWTRLISIPAQRIESFVARAAYLIYAIFKYTIYRAYAQITTQRELQQAFRDHLTHETFQQAASSIEFRVLEVFTNRSQGAL